MNEEVIAQIPQEELKFVAGNNIGKFKMATSSRDQRSQNLRLEL